MFQKNQEVHFSWGFRICGQNSDFHLCKTSKKWLSGFWKKKHIYEKNTYIYMFFFQTVILFIVFFIVAVIYGWGPRPQRISSCLSTPRFQVGRSGLSQSGWPDLKGGQAVDVSRRNFQTWNSGGLERAATFYDRQFRAVSAKVSGPVSLVCSRRGYLLWVLGAVIFGFAGCLAA